MNKNKKWIKSIFILPALILVLPISVTAQSASPNYKVEESYFGIGGEVNSTSPNYQSRQSTGSLGVGNSSSSNFDVAAGSNTPSEPFLEAAVTGASVNFGTFSPTTTSYAAAQGGTCNCTFYVRSYLSSEYAVISASQPPTNENGDVLDAKATQGAASSNASTEEFGINLVANTSPGSFGANLVNEPDGTFADGKVSTGYQTANQYKYVANDVIASSPATTGNPGIGKTNYTISYIAKVSNTSPAGVYTMRHNLIFVPTF